MNIIFGDDNHVTDVGNAADHDDRDYDQYGGDDNDNNIDDKYIVKNDKDDNNNIDDKIINNNDKDDNNNDYDNINNDADENDDESLMMIVSSGTLQRH